MKTIRVGVVGGTGYTGSELLRILVLHPKVEVAVVSSRSEEGRRVDDVYPSLRGLLSLEFCSPDALMLRECDLVFFATPNGTAMRGAPDLVEQGVRVIDLAADFRLKDLGRWSAWYGMEHACPDLVDAAVYGLPELNRESIREAQVVANPGCYPTAVTLGLLPLVEAGVIDLAGIVADCKSGSSGAGRAASVATLLSEAGESFKAYAASGHRHLPEIVSNLEAVADSAVDLTFVPHLLPMVRGIEATIYTALTDSGVDVQRLFVDRYAKEPFVDVMPEGSLPETRSVRGANLCRIALHRPSDADKSAIGSRLVVLSVIDNLVKGAAGQAVQNMNIMFGFDEMAGLMLVPLAP